MANYCSNCGLKLRGTESFCPDCGMQISKRPEEYPIDSPSKRIGTEDGDVTFNDGRLNQAESSGQGDRGAYLATIAGGILWLVFLVIATVIGPQEGTATETPYFGYLILFSGLAWIASIVTMYVDLRSMEHRLWGTRPAAWILGAILLYVLTLPIYVYKRHVSVTPDS